MLRDLFTQYRRLVGVVLLRRVAFCGVVDSSVEKLSKNQEKNVENYTAKRAFLTLNQLRN